MEIPKQLQNPDFRFVLLKPKGKEPIGSMKNWQETNCEWDNPTLQFHLEQGGNYGIIGGYTNLILIDADTKEINDLCSFLPNTFTIKTGSPEEYKHHYYFICDSPMKPIRLSKEKLGDLGDIRSVGQYVVAPNSIHPSGNPYKVINDIPIAKMSEAFVKSIFKEYIDKNDLIDLKDKSSFPIDTKKRDSPFIKNCNVPDYALNNNMKKNTSKNWKLFPYIIDILNARQVSPTLYEKLAQIQEHDFGAVKGWVIKAKEGKLAKTSCQKMRDYIDRFHPELKEKICGNCKLDLKLKKEDKNKEDKRIESLGKAIQFFTNKRDLAKQFIKLNPLYYDKNKLWWVWESKEYKWKIIDETDILNSIAYSSPADTINSKEKNEILEALKQIARENKPEEIKPTWIQFRDLIVDIQTGEEMKASPEYFVTNPIPWELNKNKFVNTPVMDKIFGEWVGEKYVKTLYEIIAYSMLPAYPIHRLFCLIGFGMNGKSCFLRLIGKFIGEENITSTELDTLLSSRFEVTRLHKKLVCTMGETNFAEISKTSILKKLTGQDMIGFEYKNKNPFTAFNYAKIFIATNNLPSTTDKTIGFYRRWCIIDFPNQFSEKKDILKDIPEEEYEILAVKCLGILKDLLERKEFTNEGTVEERSKKYEDKSNFFDSFWKEFITESLQDYITVADFEKQFEIFCKSNRQRVLNSQKIKEKMKEKGIEQGKPYMEWWENDKQIKRQVRAWIGIKWK